MFLKLSNRSGLYGALETVKRYTVHGLFAYMFVAVGTIVDSSMMITFPLRWIGYLDLHRNIVRKLTFLHWTMITSMGHWWSDMDVTLYANPEDAEKFGKERAVIVMNHKYQLDWLATWIIALHYGVLENFKAIVKSSLLFVPYIGWSLWVTESIFIKRNAKTDAYRILKHLSEKFTAFKYNYWLLLFCEGTRITASKQKASLEYASKHGLKPLKHHLLPRSKGFTLVRKGLANNAEALYDATVVCPGDEPPSLSTFVSGKREKVDVLMRRIPFNDVPIEEENCCKFLGDIYQKKDELCEFYQNNGKFPIQEDPQYHNYIAFKIPRDNSSLVILILWTILLVPPLLACGLYVFVSGIWMRYWLYLLLAVIAMSITSRTMLNSGMKSSSYGQKA